MQTWNAVIIVMYCETAIVGVYFTNYVRGQLNKKPLDNGGFLLIIVVWVVDVRGGYISGILMNFPEKTNN